MATIRKRGESWNVQVRKKGFSAQTATFDSKAEAEAWARKIEREVDLGVAPVTKTLATVSDVFSEYLEHEIPKRRDPRRAGVSLTRVMNSLPFRTKVVTSVTAEDIRRWRDGRLKLVKSSSVNRDMNTLSAVFTYAIKELGLPLPANPVHLVSRPPQPRARTQRWSAKDLLTVFRYCGYRKRTLMGCIPWVMLLAIRTTMRRGDIFSARIEDIHWSESYLHLRSTKNGDERNVPLTYKAKRVLRHLASGRKDGELMLYSPDSFTNYVARMKKATGLTHLNFHDTRREGTTRISKKLSNVLELSAVTGHKSLKYLKVYYQPNPSDLAEKMK